MLHYKYKRDDYLKLAQSKVLQPIENFVNFSNPRLSCKQTENILIKDWKRESQKTY